LPYYRIKARGQLPADIGLRFEGLTVVEEDGDTLICASVADQSALYGILAWLRDLNLDLLSVQFLETGFEKGGNSEGERHPS
jgi:hypothetical protein